MTHIGTVFTFDLPHGREAWRSKMPGQPLKSDPYILLISKTVYVILAIENGLQSNYPDTFYTRKVYFLTPDYGCRFAYVNVRTDEPVGVYKKTMYNVIHDYLCGWTL